ncbi:MAG: putative transposase, partial [Gemmatimonadales bacterium]
MRAPCVKTLRRKLAELICQKATAGFGETLSRLWVGSGFVATAYLYVDGHMKAYSGKRKLAEVWNSQRRMPLPGVLSYFVGDQRGRPLLFVTEEVFGSLSKSMPKIVQAIRAVVGDRGFTVIFDRGGYDGKLFEWLCSQGIGFITYQRGSPGLPAGRFSRREARFEGGRIRFFAAEDEVKVGGSGPWRRIVVRTPTGHQTPILTSLAKEQVGAARIACLMFARWRQENFFRYMGSHHGLDQLVSYAWGDASDQMIPDPQRKRLAREIASKRKQAAELRASLGDAVLGEPRSKSRSAHGLKIAGRGTVGTLRALEREIEQLRAQRKACPTHVPLSVTGQARQAMRLEHKTLVDRIKITAYNAEEWMLDRLGRHYPNPHDIRDLLRSFADLSGEMRSTPGGVVVTLDAP